MNKTPDWFQEKNYFLLFFVQFLFILFRVHLFSAPALSSFLYISICQSMQMDRIHAIIVQFIHFRIRLELFFHFIVVSALNVYSKIYCTESTFFLSLPLFLSLLSFFISLQCSCIKCENFVNNFANRFISIAFARL